MDKYKCKKCGPVDVFYTVKIVWKAKRGEFDPKTVLYIKVSCAKCLGYIEWAPQTEKLITEISRQLEEIKLYPSATSQKSQQLSLVNTKGT